MHPTRLTSISSHRTQSCIRRLLSSNAGFHTCQLLVPDIHIVQVVNVWRPVHSF
jgi:hypothetical protein